MMPTVSIKDGARYYKATVSQKWLEKNDNGHSVSIGFAVGEDLTAKQLASLSALGRLKEITREEWLHSGCQSSCVQRGGKECRW